MNVSVDIVITAVCDDSLKVLMIRRGEGPFQGKLALPGVLVSEDEPLHDASYRALREEAKIKEPIPIEQLHSYGDDIHRDPRNRVLSVAYIALLNYIPDYSLGDRVSDISLYDYDAFLASSETFAFDHREILLDAREWLKKKALCSDVAFALAGDTFTLSRLQRIYELLLGRELYKANFRRKIKDQVEETGQMTRGDAYRPSKLYRKKG